MRIKTFIATYLLFLSVLFASVGMVSFFLTNNQLTLLQENSAGQFQTIARALDRDLTALWARGNNYFYEALEGLFTGYVRYYERHDIALSLVDLRLFDNGTSPESMMIVPVNGQHVITIGGALAAPFDHHLLVYTRNISTQIAEMQGVQRILLFSAVAFSLVAAVGLYVILSALFKPLDMVAAAARRIADGEYTRRIPVTARNEMGQVAIDFNKMAASIERQIESRQQFVDNFAHEMRTPLTAIYGFAEYLQKAPLADGELVDLTDRIMHRAHYLQEIAASLLQLARLRTYTPVKTDIDMPSLFADLAHTLHSEAIFYEAISPTLHGQEDLIKSLLLNLCFNALKACPPESARIRVTYDNGTLSVSDNGCGIPPELLDKICEPFYRIDTARNRKDGGVGLGLTLCHRIAQVHGATMRINSTVGVGTTVAILFAKG